jgi:hypothetical protein
MAVLEVLNMKGADMLFLITCSVRKVRKLKFTIMFPKNILTETSSKPYVLKVTYQPTNSIEQSPSSEANNHSASQKIPCL